LDLDGLSQYEMEQAILNQEPRSPSSQVAASFPVGKKQLSGDLDAIALKAIRKEPDKRYRVTNQFLLDLKSYQQNLPVGAHTNSFKYRAQKLFQRHRVAITAAIGVLMLITGIVGFYTARITEERNRAQFEAEKATDIQEFLINI